MSDVRFQIVFITASDADQAARIARTLVEERLAACVSIVAPCRSIYRWQGEIVEENEVMMFAKTKREDFAAVVRRVTELHSYEVPEVIAVALDSISGDYETFLKDALG
jgi:periplasmic divalent cation tolerance protein